MVIYYSRFPDSPYINLETLIQKLSEPYYAKQRQFVYLMTVNGLLTFAMIHHYDVLEKLEPLVNIYCKIATQNGLHYMISRGVLYKAYIAYIKKNQSSFEGLLFQYANSILIKGDQQAFAFYNRLIQCRSKSRAARDPPPHRI